MDILLVICYMVLYLLVFMCGACVASFLNAVAQRLPRGESFVSGRSHCDSCGESLSLAEMIPVLSWFIMGGRCNHCGAAVSARYPLVEAVGGTLFALAYLVHGGTLYTLAVLVMFSALLLLSLVDIDTMIIPDSVLVVLMLPAVYMLLATPETPVLSHFIGMLCVSGPFFLLTLAIPDSFGGGDIKLFAVCGLALGWRLTLFALVVSLLTGGFWGIYLLLTKRASRGEHIVFGPFISAGVAAAVLIGTPVVAWYTGLL